MDDLINTLPTLRPAEVGKRWFAKATSDFTAGPFKLGKVKLVAHIKSPLVQVDVTLGGLPVEIRFLRLDTEQITVNTLLGASRDEAGNLVIDYQDCD
jgi:hypothetical protein